MEDPAASPAPPAPPAQPPLEAITPAGEQQPAPPPAGPDTATPSAGPSAAEPQSGGGTYYTSSGQRARPQKTPFQKETLEAAFEMNRHPTEEMRRVLAERIDLTEQQVGTWFQHRRQRKRKEQVQQAVAQAVLPGAPAYMAGKPGDGGPEEDGKGAEDPAAVQELAALLELAAAHLPVPFRPDGPPLALEFDAPPAAAPIGAAGFADAATQAAVAGLLGKRPRPDGAADPDPAAGGAGPPPKKPSAARPGGGGSGAKPARPAAFAPGDLDRLRAEDEARAALLAERARLQDERLEASIRREQERLARERERVDGRVARERERELQRLELERRRHAEKSQKEQKKEEERRAREAARLKLLQEKEEKRLAALADKERRAEERRRALEERRKEKDQLKALQQQEKAVLRLRVRDFGTGPRDDADLEWEDLIAEYRTTHGLPEDDFFPSEGDPAPEGLPPLPQRPQWPPADVALIPAFPPELGGTEAGPGLLEAWSFLTSFSGELGLEPAPLDSLLAALARGSRSPALAAVHCGLLRTLQADAEEAWAAGPASTYGGLESSAAAARLLEEAWAWGFDPDAWRAHLGAATWPEVARQLATAAGLGRPRPRPRREEKPKMGREGEDVADDGAAGGGLRLKLPPRLGLGTVKAAAWAVLAEVGAAGLKVDEIARRIQRRGLRDLRSSRTPEASVAGALGRDVLFARVDLGTYALAAIVAYEAKLAAAGGKEGAAPPGVAVEPGDAAAPAGAEDGASLEGLSSPRAGRVEVVQSEAGEAGEGAEGAQPGGEDAVEPAAAEEEEYSDDDEDGQDKTEEGSGAGWVEALQRCDYDALSWEHRVDMLRSLCLLAMQTPCIRDTMERRQEEQQRLKRQVWEDAKVEKRRRQVEAAARARAAAEEAARAVERYRLAGGGGAASTAASTAGEAAGDEAAGVEAAGVEAGDVVSLKPESGTDQATAPVPGEMAGPPQEEPHAGAEAADAYAGQAVEAKAGEPTRQEQSDGPAPMEIDGTAPEAASAARVEASPVKAEDGAGGNAPAPQQRLPEGASPPAAGAREDPASDQDPGAVAERERVAAAIAAAERAATERETEDREAARARQAARAEQVLRDMERCAVRLEPLGADRRFNHYWRLVLPGSADHGTSIASPDPGAGRIFFESGEDGALSIVRDAASLDALVGALERRGAREAGLYASLLRHRDALAAAMPARPLALPPADDDLPAEERARLAAEHTAALQACGITRAGRARTGAGWSPFAAGDSEEATKLKADLLRIKDALAPEALAPGFDAGAWAARLLAPGTPEDLRAALGALEAALLPSALSPLFPRAPAELLGGAWLPVGAGSAGAGGDGGDGAAGGEAEGAGDKEHDAPRGRSTTPAGSQPQLAWLPATHASLALRVLSLDAALVPRPGEAPARQSLEGYCRALRPAVVDGKQGRVVAGQPLGIGGRVRPVSFPPLPHKLLYGPRREFAFPLAQFQRDVVNNSDASIAVARPKGVGRGRGRGRGRGSALAAAEGRRPGVSRATPRIVGSSKKERRAMLTQKSELAKEFENSGSDSERHYGTDFDEDQEEFNAGGSAVPSAGGDLPSGAPSALPSEDEAISDEGSGDEEGSDQDA
uniref:Homeobox domain-containing protein n=2 Tax=Auxenochlorella protothecoides TaxID=3075 RepID=A0A1D1ZYU9_AUXPR